MSQTNSNDWLLKKNLRTVDGLRLWSQNPRLDPNSSYVTTHDFAEEMISSDQDRSSFMALIRSIAEQGFIPADPIVVWQSSSNQRFYVAEGNRRILAMKLLRDPTKAPRSIRPFVTKNSELLPPDRMKRVFVSVAPTFEDVEWYISQRHSTVSQQRKWTSMQQRRWISDLYEKYNGNLDEIRTRIQITESELQEYIRLIKLNELIVELDGRITEQEMEQATSHRFPLTTLERFFKFKDVKDAWGIEFDGYNIYINSDHNSFLDAFAEAIKRMLLEQGHPDRIDSRTISTTEGVKRILETLPTVLIEVESDDSDSSDADAGAMGSEDPEGTTGEDKGSDENTSPINTKEENEKIRRALLRNNPERPKLIPYFYYIETDSFKLDSLFRELKKIPLSYKNSVAAAIRIFLDLAVDNYIASESLIADLQKVKKSTYRDITLAHRLDFIKDHLKDRTTKDAIQHLLNPENEFSLRVLNGYVHSDATHSLRKDFLNGFWDFLFPLFSKLVVIKETK